MRARARTIAHERAERQVLTLAVAADDRSCGRAGDERGRNAAHGIDRNVRGRRPRSASGRVAAYLGARRAGSRRQGAVSDRLQARRGAARSVGAGRLASGVAARRPPQRRTRARHHGGRRTRAARGAPDPDRPSACTAEAGDNRLEIDVDFHFRAGMSSLVIGPTALVRPAHLSAETWNVVVPQAMNVVATGLALLMLTIWLRRRSEREQRGARRRFGARAQFLVDELRFGSVRAHRPRDPGSRTRRFRSGRERHGSYGARPLRRQVLVHLQSGIVSGANTVLGTVAITITDDVLTGVGTPTYRRACRTRPSTWTAR